MSWSDYDQSHTVIRELLQDAEPEGSLNSGTGSTRSRKCGLEIATVEVKKYVGALPHHSSV
jgi:hypothetical protein